MKAVKMLMAMLVMSVACQVANAGEYELTTTWSLGSGYYYEDPGDCLSKTVLGDADSSEIFYATKGVDGDLDTNCTIDWWNQLTTNGDYSIASSSLTVYVTHTWNWVPDDPNDPNSDPPPSTDYGYIRLSSSTMDVDSQVRIEKMSGAEASSASGSSRAGIYYSGNDSSGYLVGDTDGALTWDGTEFTYHYEAADLDFDGDFKQDFEFADFNDVSETPIIARAAGSTDDTLYDVLDMEVYGQSFSVSLSVNCSASVSHTSTCYGDGLPAQATTEVNSTWNIALIKD